MKMLYLKSFIRNEERFNKIKIETGDNNTEFWEVRGF